MESPVGSPSTGADEYPSRAQGAARGDSLSESVFVGRQPILDRRRHVVAYELLYRDSAEARAANFQHACQAATRVIVNTFSAMGANAVLGRARGFVNVPEELLDDSLLRVLPADRVVIELLETIKASPAVIEACEELKEYGFTLAVDDWVEDDPREALLTHADIVKIDLPEIPPERLGRLVRSLRRRSPNVTLLAEKVETQEEFARCSKLGFDLFQGYFFAKPVVVEGSSVDPDRATLMKVIAQIDQDADNVALAQQVKSRVKLSVNLLRLVNSAASGRAHAVQKVEDAIIHIGRKQLRRWLTILLYAGGDDDGIESPLLQSAAHRGRLMELAAGLSFGGEPPKELADRAFLTGMLSLVDALLGRPLEELLEEMGVADEIREALLERSGSLGRLLELVETIEAARFSEATDTARSLGIDVTALQQAYADSYAYVHDLVGQQ